MALTEPPQPSSHGDYLVLNGDHLSHGKTVKLAIDGDINERNDGKSRNNWDQE